MHCSSFEAGKQRQGQNEVHLSDVCQVFQGERITLSVCHRTDECAQLQHPGKLPACCLHTKSTFEIGWSSGKHVTLALFPAVCVRVCVCVCYVLWTKRFVIWFYWRSEEKINTNVIFKSSAVCVWFFLWAVGASHKHLLCPFSQNTHNDE